MLSEEKEIVDEIDVVFVPFRSQLNVMQFPLQDKESVEFSRFLQVSHCEYRTQQKRLDMHYKLTGPIDNFNGDHQQQQSSSSSAQSKILEDSEFNESHSNQQAPPAVTYTSKLINNQTNYFATRYDPISKQLMLYAVDSFMQMRPKLKEQDMPFQKGGEKDKLEKNISKLSKEKERDEQLRKKHPQKYIDMKLKNFNSYNEIYDSEEPLRLAYHQSIDAITDRRFRCFSEPPKETHNLTPVTKTEFQENLESGGMFIN